MEYALCKVQYVRKAETAFNIGLKNHRKDPSNPKFIDLYLRKPLIQSARKIYINRTTK